MAKNQDFINYLTEASKTVEQWPTWKKNGSDTTSLQSEVRNKPKKMNGRGVFAQTRYR
ncbi:hypothetical protein [Cedecea neteri]|uniref:hypothetical protein n=1 Tax=Cedecea neteri TaxID=158822 RepID=UPI00289A34F3|nr:hypothetical protein [Cedecea neteri]